MSHRTVPRLRSNLRLMQVLLLTVVVERPMVLMVYPWEVLFVVLVVNLVGFVGTLWLQPEGVL